MSRLVRLATLALACTLSLARPALGAEPAKALPTVAVLYFDYQGTDEEIAVLRKGLAQMLIVDLAQNKSLRVVERERFQDILDELNLNRTTRFDQATVAKIGKLLGAQYLVAGTILHTLGRFHISARAIRLQTSEIPVTASVQGKPEDFLELEQQLADGLAKGLAKLAPPDPTPTSGTKPDGAGPFLPPTKKAPVKVAARTVARYSRALDALDRKDKVTAQKELEAVVKEQPDFALASAELANLVR